MSAFSENNNVSASAQKFCSKTQNAEICNCNRKQSTRISGHTFGSGKDLINTVTANEFTNCSYANEPQKHVNVAVMILKIGVMNAVAVFWNGKVSRMRGLEIFSIQSLHNTEINLDLSDVKWGSWRKKKPQEENDEEETEEEAMF